MRDKSFRTLLPGMLAASILAVGPTVQEAGASFFDTHFQRIATFANYKNNGSENLDRETVSEIVAATKDGVTLVYTDSPGQQIGFVNIRNPRRPMAAGVVALDGEPTSVDVLGNRFALVAVNTSESYTAPSGKLVVVDISTRAIVGTIDLGGQPDSIKISPDGKYAAIAIENERDEDVTIDGVEGGLPQLPAGYLTIIAIRGTDPGNWTRRDVPLTGLACNGSDDPEPEFVDINANNEAVVSLQENNHIAIVNLATGKVTKDFSAGSVTLQGVDATEDKVISQTETLSDIAREPDAVAWVGQGRGPFLLATANEGDLFGGSRGFSLFNRQGKVAFDSGTSLEKLAVQHGHYPESRSENKGTEPEAIEYGRYRKDDYLFVGSERGSFVAVYTMIGAKPIFKQLLPAPLAPEGLLAIPSRNLLIATGESDDPSYGVRSTIMIYQLQKGAAEYPQIKSAKVDGQPIPWSALSGMVGDDSKANRVLAVWDSAFSQSGILTMNTATRPALITQSTMIKGGSGNYDPEGIAIAPDETLWIASEGNKSDSRPNRLVQVDRSGNVVQEVGLPAEILACRQATQNTATLGSGFEGVSILPGDDGRYKLLVAQQRGWDYTTSDCEDLDDDAGGLNVNNEPNNTRIWIYDPSNKSWEHIAWELADLPANASWMGLSEITRTPDGAYLVIERDNLTGDFAASKKLVRFEMAAASDDLISASDKKFFDLLPEMKASHGWISDKIEGVAVTKNNHVFAVTDNDGVEDWSGETQFLDLGDYESAKQKKKKK